MKNQNIRSTLIPRHLGAVWMMLVSPGFLLLSSACSGADQDPPLIAPTRPAAEDSTPPALQPLEPFEARDPVEVAVAEPVMSEPAEEPDPPAAPIDFDALQLTAIPDFGPIDGCSRQRFVELEGLASTLVYPYAGSEGTRARNALVEAGKEAFPVILNEMKDLSLFDDEGFRSADICQKTLTDICNGMNFGWHYPSLDPEGYLLKDEKIIRAWCKVWVRAEQDDAIWRKLTKQPPE